MVREGVLSPVMKGGHTDAVDSIRGWRFGATQKHPRELGCKGEWRGMWDTWCVGMHQEERRVVV